MKFLKSVLIRILMLLLLCGSYIDVFGETTHKQDTNSYSQEQDNLSKIAEFRANYIPKEYHPLSENLVYVDMLFFLVVMLLGLYFIIKKKPANWLTWLAIGTFAYIGFLRGGCICPMGLTTNAIMGIIDPYQVSLVGLVLFLSPLVLALIAGRIFCTSGCPLGAIQHIFYKKKKDYKIPAKLNRYIKVVPILVLLATIFFAISGTIYLGCVIDPYKPIFFTGKVWSEQGIAYLSGNPMESRFLLSFGIFAWLYLIGTLVAGYWIQRPFCRLLCPYSALLGATSLISFRQRKIDKAKCTYCTLCVKKCPTQAITINKQAQIQQVSNYDCIQCNRCTDSCKSKAI